MPGDDPVEQKAEKQCRCNIYSELEHPVPEPGPDGLLRDAVRTQHRIACKFERQRYAEHQHADEHDERGAQQDTPREARRERRANSRSTTRERDPEQHRHSREFASKRQAERRRRPSLCGDAPLGVRVGNEEGRLLWRRLLGDRERGAQGDGKAEDDESRKRPHRKSIARGAA